MLVPKVKLLTASESADLTGVSIDTINQYRDFGLLKVQNIQGVDYFEEDDVRLIFNSRIVSKKVVQEEPIVEKAQDKFEDPELPTLSSILNEEAKDPKIVRIHADKVAKEPTLLHGELEEKSGSLFSERSSYVESEGPSSIEILELSRSLKQQLELVRSERDWLRQRVEKLEVQLERQQMISMTETETLRIMAKGREEKPSPWAFLLSWAQPKN